MSWAVTVRSSTPPAVTGMAPVTANEMALPGETSMFESDPVKSESSMSLAVIDSVAAVLNVTSKVPTPLVRVESAGRTAWPSLLVRWTVPE